MKRKRMIASGSSRRKGNSATLSTEVADGARSAGAKVETLSLQVMDIKP